MRKTIISTLIACALSHGEMPKYYMPEDVRAKAMEWKKDYLAKNSKSVKELKHRYLYDETESGILEWKVTPKNGKTTIFQVGLFKGVAFSNSSGKYIQTKKQNDIAQYKIEQRRKDVTFFKIETAIMQIASEYRYDYLAAYGIEAKYRNPDVRKAVCDGYANAVIERLKNEQFIANVEKWTSEKGRHAWNVASLKDGRKIYIDATWYQGQGLDNDGYVKEIPDRNPATVTYDINEFNSLGGAVDSTGAIAKIHFAWEDAKKAGE